MNHVPERPKLKEPMYLNAYRMYKSGFLQMLPMLAANASMDLADEVSGINRKNKALWPGMMNELWPGMMNDVLTIVTHSSRADLWPALVSLAIPYHLFGKPDRNDDRVAAVVHFIAGGDEAQANAMFNYIYNYSEEDQ